MATISNYLRGVADQLTGQAKQKAAAGQAQVGLQTQQALTQGPINPLQAKVAAQGMAPQITTANAQVTQAASADADKALVQAAGQAVQQGAVQQQQNLAQRAIVDENEIQALQRQGKLKQNAAELDAQKRMEEKELAAQSQRQVQGIAFDNRLSFLTRKQREDLASIGSLAKQQIFDSRLQFEESEGQRKFTNMRQLADYATATAADQQQLEKRMSDMQHAFGLEMIALDSAQKAVTTQLTLEMKRSENAKDNALALELAQAKSALEQKIRRKKAQAAGNAMMIQGAFTIVGAVVGSIIPGAGTAAGAAVGGAVGGVVASAAAPKE